MLEDCEGEARQGHVILRRSRNMRSDTEYGH